MPEAAADIIREAHPCPPSIDRKALRPLLRRELGIFWNLRFSLARRRGRALFRRTHWYGRHTPEAEFIARLAVLPALYRMLKLRFGQQQAIQKMRPLCLAVGLEEQWYLFERMPLNQETTMKRLLDFNTIMERFGIARFNPRRYTKLNESVCHFIVTRCVVHDFLREARTPELAPLFCEIDYQFYPRALTGLRFHRGSARDNTIANGRNHCDFVWETKF